ncbi:hypothetical protein [Streptomyces sp. NK15101]|uniref:hypothetical protein n=1 Tax=Streptomyces sp. NK15101 TaxID=2873261 RepID=UPI001CEC6004|nr:hypothetical protein [Streptomyces sp. NK15101]
MQRPSRPWYSPQQPVPGNPYVPAASQEYAMLAGHPAHAKGRIVITPPNVSGDDGRHRARVLSFAPAAP